jgi:hypothetical protein
MTLPTPTPAIQPNPVTQAAHRKQMIWQVYVPLFVCIAALITGTVFAVSGGAEQTGQWASVSIIFLILPALTAGMVGLLINGLMIYGLARLLKVVPPFSVKVQKLFAGISSKTTDISNKAVSPIIGISGWSAGAHRIFRK